MTPRRSRLRLHVRLTGGVLALMLALLLSACSPGQPATTSVASSLAARPASPAQVEIVQPTANATLTGTTVHIVLKLTGGTIVPQTTTTIKPDEGHVHLYVDNLLVSMNYGLEQDITVPAGTHVLKAEFVAADHAPFNPRVWSTETIFTVHS
jgi:hypothetical protein